MPLFEKVRRRASRIPDLVRLSDTEILNLRSTVPGLPEDYLQFLETVGFGGLEGIQIYSGPVSPSSLYGNFKGDPSSIILFGDDMQGYCFGFDTKRGFSLVEVDPQGSPETLAEDSFLSLVAAYLLDD